MFNRVRFIHILTMVVLAIASGVIYHVMTSADFKDSDLRTQTVTALLVAFAAATGYWTNSTNSSARKTELMQK